MVQILIFAAGCAAGAVLAFIVIASPRPWPEERRPRGSKRGGHEMASWLR